MKRIPLILDGDPGHDDAIAWVLAASNPIFDIKAITCVAGNQTLDKVILNARKIATLLKLNIPIARGREIPMLADLIIAPNYHGISGLDGPELPEANIPESNLSAVELMAKILNENDDVIIVATGPQTNVASLLITHPELKKKIKLISIMGGGLRNGNWTAPAEFNILVDPESAYIEYHSDVPLMMCGLDVTEKAMIYPNEWEEIRNMDNIVAKTVAGWLDFFHIHLKELGWEGATLHDPCSILAISNPEIFKMKDLYVDIILNGDYSRGETVADYYNQLNKKANCKVVYDIDRKRFIELLIDACKSYEGWK